MSSFARRSLRTTAAAAGIAALGIGIAGPALAAPSVPDLPALPSTDSNAPAVDSAVPGPEAFFKAIDTAGASMPAMPGPFSFDAPSYQIADDAPTFEAPFSGAPSFEAPSELPAFAAPGGVVTMEGGMSQFQGGPEFDAAKSFSNNVGAMPGLDNAALLAELAQKAASGESITSNNDIHR